MAGLVYNRPPEDIFLQYGDSASDSSPITILMRADEGLLTIQALSEAVSELLRQGEDQRPMLQFPQNVTPTQTDPPGDGDGPSRDS